MANPAGESNDEALRLDFDRRLRLQFRGSVVTSDAVKGRPELERRATELLCQTPPQTSREILWHLMDRRPLLLEKTARENSSDSAAL
jgi:hypothetical protein